MASRPARHQPPLLAWQGAALAAIPIVRGIHDSDTALIVVGIAVLALRAAPAVAARAAAAEPYGQREATPLVNTASSLLITAALTLVEPRSPDRWWVWN